MRNRMGKGQFLVVFVVLYSIKICSGIECGIRPAMFADQETGDRRITGGHQSQSGSWPWMVALYVDGPPVFFKCGAALISERWVLTAGHCGLIAEGLSLVGAHTMPSRIKVRLGEHDLNSASGNEQEIVAKKVIFHPKWDILTKNTDQGPKTVSTYDMLLVELKEPAKITPQVYPICLSPKIFRAGKMCHVAGWGNEKVDGPVHGILHEAAIPVVTEQECNKPESYSGVITDDLVCAGFRQGGKDTCEGDSGGPLMCKGPDQRWYVAGISSFGHTECGAPHKYGIYAKISSAIDWITNNTGITPPPQPINDFVPYNNNYNTWNWNPYG